MDKKVKMNPKKIILQQHSKKEQKAKRGKKWKGKTKKKGVG